MWSSGILLSNGWNADMTVGAHAAILNQELGALY